MSKEEIIDDDFDIEEEDDSLTSFERKEMTNKKMEQKRKLEEYLENQRLEKELNYY